MVDAQVDLGAARERDHGVGHAGEQDGGWCSRPCAPLLTNTGTSAPAGVTITTTGSVSHHCAPALAPGAASLGAEQQAAAEHDCRDDTAHASP